MSRVPRSPRNSDAKNASEHAKMDKGATAMAVEPAGFEAEVAASAPLLHGPALTAAIAVVAGTGFTLFGYVVQCRPAEEFPC